jgi:hypothetical protein
MVPLGFHWTAGEKWFLYWWWCWWQSGIWCILADWILKLGIYTSYVQVTDIQLQCLFVCSCQYSDFYRNLGHSPKCFYPSSYAFQFLLSSYMLKLPEITFAICMIIVYRLKNLFNACSLSNYISPSYLESLEYRKLTDTWAVGRKIIYLSFCLYVMIQDHLGPAGYVKIPTVRTCISPYADPVPSSSIIHFSSWFLWRILKHMRRVASFFRSWIMNSRVVGMQHIRSDSVAWINLYWLW